MKSSLKKINSEFDVIAKEKAKKFVLNISENEKLYGLINGYNYQNQTLEIEGISNTKTVRVGDVVYTSGLGGVFPSGILIGTVKSITTDSYDLSKIIKVTPNASLENINYVSILKRKSVEQW